MSAVVFTASEALAVLRLAPRTLCAGLQRAEARFTGERVPQGSLRGHLTSPGGTGHPGNGLVQVLPRLRTAGGELSRRPDARQHQRPWGSLDGGRVLGGIAGAIQTSG